ncbi:MAG: FtsQ-type POTRA domain-containing protein [Oscillospiraceae bacterium]|jgi:cell division septal protein FtsQ|nr:FtsQ-type POTRA domain-containing protein [Oscillospiraceae bacterium]
MTFAEKLNKQRERSEAAGKGNRKRPPEKPKTRKKTDKPKSGKPRKLLRVLINILIVVVVLTVGVVLALTVFFKAETIEVSGKTPYKAEEIIAASGLQKGENIFLADKQQAEKKVVDNFPYIESARVNIKIPNGLVIEVTKAKGTYQIDTSAGEFLLISEQGRILESQTERNESLPLVLGANLKTTQAGKTAEYDDSNVNKILQQVQATLAENKFEDIRSIDVSNTSAIKLDYDDRILIDLGNITQLDYKIRTAQRIIFDKLDPENTGIIKGELDVSSSYETKKSYFNEETIDLAGTVTATTPQTSALQQQTTENQE